MDMEAKLMVEFMQDFLSWAWSLITGIQPLVEWLFNPIEILTFSVAPIYLIGGGASAAILITGILRAIL